MNLLKSKASAKFEENPHQRSINLRHVQKIARSIRDFGFLPSKPIQVYQDGKKLIIVDGHHRYEAAKSIGAEFFYVVETASAQSSMIIENVLVKPWSLVDYALHWANQGISHYDELLRYSAKGIPLGMAGSMLIGQAANSANASDPIKDGTFQVKDRSQITKVCNLMHDLGGENATIRSRTFINVISRCILTPAVDWETLVKRLTSNILALRKTANADQMLAQIEEIYNFRSQSKLPLVWAVNEKMKERNANALKKAK